MSILPPLLPLHLSNHRTWNVDESVFHPVKKPARVASDPTFARFRRAAVQSWCSSSPKGRIIYICRTTQHGCPPLSHASSSKNNVAARVVCGCLSPAAPWQGQACRPGLSTRNSGFVLGSFHETGHIRFMLSGMMESVYRHLILPYRLTAPGYGDGMGLDLACGTNCSGFRSRQPLCPPTPWPGRPG